MPPALVALALQAVSCIVVVLLVRQTGVEVSPLQTALACGALASLLSHAFGLAPWWLPIQFLFAPALLVSLALGLPPTYYLVVFLILLAIYWSVFRSQVPLYLSSRKVWQAVESLLPEDRAYEFVDVGSGLGGLLSYLSRQRPNSFHMGIELAPLPFLATWLRLRIWRTPNCRVTWGSYWDADLSRYDVVFAYLSPAQMPKLKIGRAHV